MFYYYAWRHLQQTHQKIRWNPGNTESLERLIEAQLELWDLSYQSCFLICVGYGQTQMKAKNVTQCGVITYRVSPDTGIPQLVFQSGVETRVLREGADIRKPEVHNLLPPSLRRGDE